MCSLLHACIQNDFKLIRKFIDFSQFEIDLLHSARTV